MFNALIYNRIDVSFDVFFQWGVMQSRAYTEINLWGEKISPPLGILAENSEHLASWIF